MSRAAKQLTEMEQNPKGWRYDQVAATLEAFGFVLRPRPKGSHRVFKHPTGQRVTLVDAGSGTLLPVYVEEALKAIARATEEAE